MKVLACASAMVMLQRAGTVSLLRVGAQEEDLR